MNPWDADIHLSREQAKHLVADQFAEFRHEGFRLLSNGWDNTAYLAAERYVFRFPRRKVAAHLIENENRILPLIAKHLPIPIPVPEFVGEPTDSYPFVWAGYEYLPGQPGNYRKWTPRHRAALARPLGKFLRALHGIEIPADVLYWAPRDEIARSEMKTRMPKMEERLDKLPSIIPSVDPAAIRTITHRLIEKEEIAQSSSQPLTWVHGDFSCRHILVDEQRRIMGVIDWGDVHVGEPSLDLSILYTFLPAVARPDFVDEYGAIDEQTDRKAKFRAITHALAIAEYGHAIQDRTLVREAEFCLLSIQNNN